MGIRNSEILRISFKKKKPILILIVISLIGIIEGDLFGNNQDNNYNSIEQDMSSKNSFQFLDPKVSSLNPNAKPLKITQHANITKSFSNLESGDDVSFTQVQNWIRKIQQLIMKAFQ